MDCVSEQDLHRFYDDELSPSQADAVRAHVASCEACAARLHQLQMIGDMIRAAPFPLPARQAVLRWQGRIAAVQEQSVRRLASWMTAAASIVLVVSLYAATSTQAHATPALNDWEAAVIGIDVGSSSADQATAQWIATDLSGTPPGRPAEGARP